MTRPVAVVGLGRMGGGIARRLVAVGQPVTVWNRSADRAAELASHGATAAETPGAATAAAETVLLAVADAVALQNVLSGPDGVLSALRPGATVILLSTVSPETVRALEPRVTAAGGRLLEAAMLGNGSHAEQGELRLYLGGDPRVIHQETDVLGAFAKEVTPVGPLGSGMSYKLVLNLLMGLEMQALAEITALGEGLGLDRQQLLSVVAGSGFSAPVMRFKAQRMIRRAYADPDFRLELMAKDLRLATEEATRHDVTIPMTRAATAAHREAVEAGLGGLDCAAIADARQGVPA
ncbi:MAG: hypothetical protein QOJ32_5 [Frankiaceae bacterium]|jgi:3-hydroxyisobutyrate dehydrogenase-like beta-hydroxyacid dehydrogenase|nr:hypothetical protein [Frankiaceae bacterium]